MSDFDAINEIDAVMDEPSPRPRHKRVRAVWVALFMLVCAVSLGTVLYFQYDVWVHPIHEPTDLDLAEMDLNSRLGTPVEIMSSETVHDTEGRPLLRVKYRQQRAGGGWLPGDRVYRIEGGKILWGRDYWFWKWQVD